jgi:hypothetical protein
MKFKTKGTVSQVKTLLENVEYLRDNKRDFIKQYRYFYASDMASEESLARSWRFVQQHVPSLRGTEWESRQKNNTSVRKYTKFRTQEKPEDLSFMFDNYESQDKLHDLSRLIQFKKMNWFQKIIHNLF